MKKVKSFHIHGVSGAIQRVEFDGRLVDFWAPSKSPEHLLIAHDGQNVFDRNTSTRRSTWRMAHSAVRVSEELGITPPAIIGVFHSRTADNPWGRILDLAPQDPFQNGVEPATKNEEISLEDLQGNRYLDQVTQEIAPAIAAEIGMNLDGVNKAVIGSSMGGLASLYALGKRPDFFTTALALSPHWSAGDVPLVDALINALPIPGVHKVWMSRGTRGLDQHYGPFQEHADQKMLRAGWHEGEDFITRVYAKSGHERSWAKYLDEPMKFWLRPLNRLQDFLQMT
jgi:predicted alpha/beta superfamily hydrolase